MTRRTAAPGSHPFLGGGFSAAREAAPGDTPGAAALTPRGRRLLWLLLALALLLRLAHWWAVRDEPFFARLVMDSQEYDRWAREIAGGDWLGREVFFQAPLYPYLVALLYKVLPEVPDTVYLAQMALALAGLWALARAGASMGGERVGLAAAGLGAVYGPFLFYDVQLLKESLAVATAAFLLWALAAARQRRRPLLWLAAGALLGVLALLRENALLLVPFLLPLAWPAGAGRSRDGAGVDAGGAREQAPGAESDPGLASRAQARPAATGTTGSRAVAAAAITSRCPAATRPLGVLLRSGLAFLLGLTLALAPVALRNFLVGGDPLPTTFQGGVNFYIGNNPEADGTYRPIVPGKQVPALERREPVRLAEQELGRTLTPAEASSFWLRRALAWAAAEPGAYLRLQLRKLRMFWSWYEWPDAVDYYWVQTLSPVFRFPLLEFGGAALLAAVGLLLARRHLGPFAPALLFLLGWTVSTVLFFLFSRYRLPMVPALLILAAVPVAELSRAGGRGRRACLLGASCLLALVLPRLAGHEPRLDLVHDNLGRLEMEAGRPEAAAAHYRAALAANPDDFFASLNLGSLAARAGDFVTAHAAYTHAAALEPRSDEAWSNLGGASLALGRLDDARQHLDRALALNPHSLSALQNRALLALREGDLATARELNRRTLALAPANPAALRLRDRLMVLEPS